jgi:hypothetical protein
MVTNIVRIAFAATAMAGRRLMRAAFALLTVLLATGSIQASHAGIKVE